MALLGKDAILAADDLKTQIVEVPEWGGEVKIRTLTGSERDEFEAGSVKRRGQRTEADYGNFRARFCALIIVDEAGFPIFTSKADIRALGAKSVKGLDRIFTAGQELNALSDKDVEELEGDFEKDTDEASTSV